jgi:hypothetical protein
MSCAVRVPPVDPRCPAPQGLTAGVLGTHRRSVVELARGMGLRVPACRDSRIGFESAHHCTYTLNALKEKVIQCLWLRQGGQR